HRVTLTRGGAGVEARGVNGESRADQKRRSRPQRRPPHFLARVPGRASSSGLVTLMPSFSHFNNHSFVYESPVLAGAETRSGPSQSRRSPHSATSKDAALPRATMGG